MIPDGAQLRPVREGDRGEGSAIIECTTPDTRDTGWDHHGCDACCTESITPDGAQLRPVREGDRGEGSAEFECTIPNTRDTGWEHHGC